MQCERETNFIETLCWVIQPDNVDHIEKGESRVASPQMIVKIAKSKYKILIDWGSDVTL